MPFAGRGLGPVVLSGLLFVLCPVFAAAQDVTIYDDALRNAWQDWTGTWAVHSLTCASPVHAGVYSISLVPSGWRALYLHGDTAVSGADYSSLDFYIHGGSSGGQNLRLVFLLNGSSLANRPLTDFLPGGPAAGTWSAVHVNLSAIGLGSASFNELYFQDGSGGTQGTVFLDDIKFTAGAPVPLTVAVDPAADRRAVDPRIFGVSLMDEAPAGSLAYPFRRWGGNWTSRYNWQLDARNVGSDWFYFNYIWEDPLVKSAADRFLDDCRTRGEEPLLSVPMIGWTPRDRVRRWGFSVAKYGPQQNNECIEAGWPAWCNADAGNGNHTDGTPVTGNDPADTSVAAGPALVTGWMDHIIARLGTAAGGGLRYYALDNEPMLWNSTHRDVHPVPVDDAEIWSKTLATAAAIKAKDPAAVTFGPVVWGWCAYFYSAHDGCGPGTDYLAHGPFLEWYLAQVEAYRQANGVRLVDVLDIHYYPQSTGVALSDDESAGTAATRLRSVKSLYDPSYVDESWIGSAVQLIPRMKDIIARKAPGTKLAITEYNWGGDTGHTSALAQVEVLGIFAREGVDAANRWVAPEPGTAVEQAFRLYLNYDGAGAVVDGENVRAVSSRVDDVGVYAFSGPDGFLRLVLVNKATADRSVPVTVSGGMSGQAALYGFEAGTTLGARGSVVPAGDTFTVPLPARSARLAVVRLACTLPGNPGSTLHLSKSTGQLKFAWGSTAGAVDYLILEDTTAGGAFATTTATGTDGAIGVTAPLPSGLRFYRVGARNACGVGPLN